jgi:hypothetical protein
MKSAYTVAPITKRQCVPLLHNYHYLTGLSKGFKSGDNYGLYHGGKAVGVCIFTSFPVPELVQGMFGLDRTDQEGFYELSRLVLHPEVQATEHNLASWFVARAVKRLRKANNVRAILTYADNDYHTGTVYKALGFTYYGLSDTKSDFFIEADPSDQPAQADFFAEPVVTDFVKHSRGPVKGLAGEWRPRSRKHRFLKVYDNSLNVLWREQPYNQIACDSAMTAAV